MKTVTKPILSYQEPSFFSPIRKKIDYVKLIAHSARQLLMEIPDQAPPPDCSLKLVVDKMSRLFVYREAKYFSVSFPFIVSLDDQLGVRAITTLTGNPFDSEAISKILSVIYDGGFESDCSLIRYYLSQDESDRPDLHLLEEIFQTEPGYIRYDCDDENEDGDRHPLHHLDVNYSQYSTFKLGLAKAIEREYFEDLQNIRTDCRYIQE